MKWFYKPAAVVVALLCVGPLALPLLWLSPAFRKPHKYIITILVIVLTVVSVKSFVTLYNILKEHLKQLGIVLSHS